MGTRFISQIEPRYGFYRAYGSFDHPILWGVFAGSVIGIAWSLFQSHRRAVNAMALCVVVLGTLTSVSSGALVAIWAQLAAIVYERSTRTLPYRWSYFWIAIAVGYAVIESLSTRSAFVAVTTRISFSPGTAYGRATIFQYGVENITNNPVFGIGLNEWVRPDWLSTSVDNFWLLTTMMYGIPGLILFTSGLVYVLFANWKIMSESTRLLRFGLTVSIAGLVVAGGTVHFWNSIYVYFVFLIGCGTLFSSHSAIGTKAIATARKHTIAEHRIDTRHDPITS